MVDNITQYEMEIILQDAMDQQGMEMEMEMETEANANLIAEMLNVLKKAKFLLRIMNETVNQDWRDECFTTMQNLVEETIAKAEGK